MSRGARIIGACAVLAAGCTPGPAGPAGLGRPSVSNTVAGDAYYLSVCAWCGGMLGGKGDTLDRAYDARDARFCSPECAAAFDREPDSGFARVDALMIADQGPRYPLKTSVVSGRPLPERPVEFIRGNRLFRVADDRERALVERDPGPHLRALDRAVIEAQRPTYGMPDKCPVQGDILASDTPIDIVIANRMVRVCCIRCAGVVRNRPSQFLSMVDYANRQAAEHADDADPDR